MTGCGDTSPASIIVNPTTGDPILGLAATDAFQRLRVSNPTTIFDGKQIYDEQPLLFVTNLVAGGTATYDNALASTKLEVTVASGDKATRQSKRYLNYQPGKSQLVFVTFVADDGPQANIDKRVGYFDDDNGVFLQLSGLVPQVVVRSNTSGAPVDTAVDQTNWNIDTLDGTGPSGVTVDFTKTQILAIDFEWLGVGIVRIGFVIDGVIRYAHTFQNANNLSVVYMQTPNLPVRWEIEGTAANAGGALSAICCSVSSEGGQEPVGISHSADRGITGIATGTTLVQVIAIRLKVAFNRDTILPRNIFLMSSTGANAHWELRLNPTFTGSPAATWVPITNSAVEYDVSRTVGAGNVNADGTLVSSGYFSSDIDNTQLNLSDVLTLASDFAGTSDELVLCVQGLAAPNETFFGGIRWDEVN